MTVEERLSSMQEKIRQYEHKKILQENGDKEAKAKIDFRRKIILGELFIKHFPIALEFTPGKSAPENEQTFKPLDDFMQALSKCLKSYQAMEDTILSRH